MGGDMAFLGLMRSVRAAIHKEMRDQHLIEPDGLVLTEKGHEWMTELNRIWKGTEQIDLDELLRSSKSWILKG